MSQGTQGSGRKANQAYYDEFAGWYERQRHQGYHAMLDELELSLVRPHCAGRRVFEAGCGTGLILRELAPLASQATGLDLSHGMLEQAGQRGLQVVQGNVAQLPFADASFDVVVSFKVLAHVEAIDLALAELARVTRPGGRLFLEFYNPLSLRYLGKRVRAGRISERTDERAVFTRWDSPSKLSALLPPELELVDLHGVRVLTPVAGVHRLPLLGPALRLAERAALRSPLRYFGGFLVAECLRLPQA